MASNALNTSMGKGQIAMVCHLCEIDPKMKWKCINCGLIMCERCKEKIHPKFPGASSHTVIDLKQVGDGSTRPGQELDFSNIKCTVQLDFSNIKCTVHSTQMCCLFCQNCDSLVCPTCVSERHNKHNLTEISKEYDAKLNFLKQRKENLQDWLLASKAGDFPLENVKIKERETYVMTRQKILDYEEKLKNAFEAAKREIADNLSILEQRWSDFIISLGKTMRAEIKKRDDIESKQTELEELKNSGNVLQLFQELKQEQAVFQPIQLNVKQIPIFSTSGQISLPKIKLDEKLTIYNLDLFIGETLETELDEISNLIVASENSMWLNDYRREILYLTQIQENKLKIRTKYQQKVTDMAVNQHGDILIADGTAIIKIIKSGDNKIADWIYNFQPFNVISIHVRGDNCLVAGVTKGGNVFDSIEPSIFIFDQEGNKIKSIGKGKFGWSFFTFPSRITTNQKHDIGVIDTLSDNYDGEFILLDKEGEVQKTYNGHEQINGKNSFRPRCVVTTPSDYFVISDYWNHNLVVLNNCGDLIAFHSTLKQAIPSPIAMCMLKPAQIYFGCSGTKTMKDTSVEIINVYKITRFPW